MRCCLVLLAIAALASTARADVTVDIHLTPQGMRLANQLGVTSEELAARLRNRIDQTIGADGATLQAFSDAAVLTSHGLGVDYVSMPESLIVGVAGSAATASTHLDVPGLAANVAVMAGFNFAALGLPRWTVYASGFSRDETVDGVAGSITSAAAHVQYTAIAPSDDGIVRWSGLLVTSGLELTHWTLSSTRDMSTELAVSGSQKVAFDATGRFGLSSRSLTVPLEVSTGVRLAVVSVYAGAGLDATTGSATLDADVAGPLRDSANEILGQATIRGNASHAASPLAARVLGGVQLDAWKLKLFGHVDATPDAASLAVGVRGVL